jgi:ssDNA-binding Zn-finger/Zn-ribbon topoisomerase 1
MPKKKPRFFCDNCGAEVDMTAKSCPACGRFFASVRCPKCGYTGRDSDFAHGCPACGYSAVPGGDPTTGAHHKPGRNSKKGAPAQSGPLPLWMYVLASLILIFVLVILYNSLQ